MKILTVNTGSSSVRLALFAEEGKGLNRIAFSRMHTHDATPEEQLKHFFTDNPAKIDAVAHRIVHGGRSFTGSRIVDEETEAEIIRLSALAPLHNPVALEWIKVCRSVLGESLPHIAVFDTAFFSHLPEVSSVYGLPKDLVEKHHIRRYGFHGIAHKAMLERWKKIRPDVGEGGKVISLQLGSGCSMSAVDKGRPIDTTMGFSPLEGLLMSTRAGDIDPGILTYLQNSAGYTVKEIDRILNRSSGLLGVSGISGDIGILIATDEPSAHLAIDLYCYRIRKYIGAYMAVLGGADALLFGGGVGENSPVIRENILIHMTWCGIEIDERANAGMIDKEGRISSANSRIEIWVISVDEERVLAEEAYNLIT